MDVLLIDGYSLGNAFAYWQGAPINNASRVYFDDIAQAIEHVQKIAGDNAKNIKFATGETGWPTGMTSTINKKKKRDIL